MKLIYIISIVLFWEEQSLALYVNTEFPRSLSTYLLHWSLPSQHTCRLAVPGHQIQFVGEWREVVVYPAVYLYNETRLSVVVHSLL